MRTTLNLDDTLVRAAKRHAAEGGRTLTSVVEQGLRAVLEQPPVSRPPALVSLPTYGRPGGHHLSPAEIAQALDDPRGA